VTAAEQVSAIRVRMLKAWGIALILGTAACLLSSRGYRTFPHPRPLEELSYYPSGQLLRPASFGHSEAAADLAWLRAVQYYGEHRRSDNRFTRMSHVFDVLTSLAPGFVPAYVFGAFALAQEGGQFPAAESLMLKGLERNPASGELAFQLGFLYYVRPGGRSLNQAAEYFEQSARQADAPRNASRFAAFARQHAGRLQVAYELWSEVYHNSPNRYLRATAEREMEKIQLALSQGKKELATQKLTTPQVVIGKK